MNTRNIRQVVVDRPGHIDVRQVAAPTAGEGQVLVRPTLVGICGSDVHASQGRHPLFQPPYFPGHEVVGVIEQVADGVEHAVGTRVVIEPLLSCGHCKHCREGRYNLCDNLLFFGTSAPSGGLTDLFAIRADRAIPIGADLTDEQAVLIEALATPVHAARLAGDLAGRDVVILGSGTIGLMTLAVARAQQAARVLTTDVSPAKRALALAQGADAVFDAADPNLVERVRDHLGGSADVIFDCVSVQTTVNQAVTLALKGGTVVIIGVPAAPVTVPLPLIQDDEVRIQGSATYTRADLDTAAEFIRAGRINPDDFITARYQMDDVAAAFQDATSGQQVKVVVAVNRPADI